MDASKGKNFGPLSEINETLDFRAYAFSAKWSNDSRQVTIIYRVDRHAPLKAAMCKIASSRARCIKGPFDVTTEELVNYWHDHSSVPSARPKTFGTPLHRA